MKSEDQTAPHMISIDGDMDALTIKQLRSQFEDVVENKTCNVIIDLHKVEFIDSSGIGALVFLFKRLTAANRSLLIKGVHGQPGDIFSFLRIDKTIPTQMSDVSKSAVK
ncbi:MAG: anti-anti-sigma factor [Rhodospirillaceae bacterium]|nr:MAG: anti-anti-sigma factor [Rhodospirillaceae bacterium]